MSRPRFVQFSMPGTRKKKRKHDDKTKGGSIQNFLHLSRCTVWKDVTLVPTLTRRFCWPLPYWSWRTCSALKLLHDLFSNSSLRMLHGYILTLTLTQCSRELAICKKTEKKRKWNDSHIYWLVVWLEIKGIFLPSFKLNSYLFKYYFISCWSLTTVTAFFNNTQFNANDEITTMTKGIWPYPVINN